MKKFKKVRKVIFVILKVIVILLIALTITHHVISVAKNNRYANVGQTVKVNNTKMRIYVTGQGDETIVMLSGLGTVSPINDFKPLAEMLGKNYKVAIVEYPGYGFSEDTKVERTNENIVNEVRNALEKANLKPPYVLMPHSISGVYSLYYAKNYPSEVKAIIGIDQSMPNQTKGVTKDKDSRADKVNGILAKTMDFVGISRIITKTPVFNEYINLLNAGGYYSKEQIEEIKEVYSEHSISNAIINESKNVLSNTKQLYDVKYPENLPVFSFLSNESIKTMKESVEKKEMDKGWNELHEEAISNQRIQKIVCLDGSHYLHWSNAEKIAKMTKEFLEMKEVSK